jgi:hypothetical protein
MGNRIMKGKLRRMIRREEEKSGKRRKRKTNNDEIVDLQIVNRNC